MEHQYNSTGSQANPQNADLARVGNLDSIQSILTDASAYARRQVGTRVSTACERCRRRKIRCDGNMPSCRPCQKVNAACVFEQRGSPRPMVTGSVSSDLAEARSRIRHLENLLVKEQRRNARTNSTSASAAPSPLSPMYAPRDALTLPPLQGQYLQSPQQQPLPPFQPSLQGPPPVASMVDPQLQRTPASAEEQQQQQQQPALAHEIGLVSLTPGSEARYIGPSSGFFFARKIMSAVSNRHILGETARRNTEELRNQLSVALAKDYGAATTSLPSTVDLCKRISGHYFRTVHVELPFLHEGQHMAMIERVYEEPTPGPISAFQVNMVLAIAAADLSRRLKVDIQPDGYFSNAQKLLDKFSTEGSLKGLQSLLLLVVFAINQPNTGLNAWYLHYETIASVIDLGLQRDVSRTQISFKEQEMRTRIFWVVYSLDRRLATMMGRPIGLRDEACELRYPVDTDDEELDRITTSAEAQRNRVTHMTWAILLFKLAQINSEIKYVLHSISKESGHFSYAPVNDLMEWQQGMIRRLENWTSQIPAASEGEDSASLRQIWLQRGYEIYILLQWPSPAIRTPHESVMHKCYQSAQASLYMLVELYQSDQLIYNTMTIHSIFVSALTMLYCLGTMPNMANAVSQPTADIEKLNQSLNALSSLGEHWTEARKARDGLGLVARPIIRKALTQRGYQVDAESAKLVGVRPAAPTTPPQNAQQETSPNWPLGQNLDDLIPSMDAFMDPDFFIAQFEGFSALEEAPNESLVDPMLSGS